ncbi:MAG TPA: CHAP domain-containing protein [Chloroflexota bacterium]|nr:CHAP domain-containing protein [Chloroflexota bacterium]
MLFHGEWEGALSVDYIARSDGLTPGWFGSLPKPWDNEAQRSGSISNPTATAIPFQTATYNPIYGLTTRLLMPRPRVALRSRSGSYRQLTHGLMLVMAVGVLAGSFFQTQQAPASGPAFDVSDPQVRAAIVARAMPFTEKAVPTPDASAQLLLPQTPAAPATPPVAKPAPELKTYVVQDGDNPYDLATAFGIGEETFMSANGLNADSVLQLGQRLLVPPVNGVLVTTQPGDTPKAIADQWKLDLATLLSINKLTAGTQALLPGEPLMLPGAAPTVHLFGDAPSTETATADSPILKPAPAARPRGTTLLPAPPPANTRGAVRRSGPNNFPYGQCTWWAAQSRPDIGANVIGNASSWLYSARASGLPTGSVPRVGAVVVYQPGAQGAAWTGHVAYVTSVAGDGVHFTISEMNFPYWGSVTRRASWTGPGVGFIY